MGDLNDFELELGQSSELGMAMALGLMMFSIALGLRVEHFRFIKKSPRIVFAGVFSQLIGLPLLTLGLCFLLVPPPSIALGMILVSCCPGGAVSNMLVLMANGNVALSVSLTAVSSLAAAFITPISILFWSRLYPPIGDLLTQVELDTVGFLSQTAVILALPLLLGALLVWQLPWAANAIRKPLVTFSGLLLFIIIAVICVKYQDMFVIVGAAFIGLVALHNASAYLLGFITGYLARADKASRRTLTYEVGIQNSGLGIVILLTQFNGLGGAAAVAGLWGVWHILAGSVLVLTFRMIDWRSTTNSNALS